MWLKWDSLPSKFKVLSSNPSNPTPPHKKKRKKKRLKARVMSVIPGRLRKEMESSSPV
jgi:hypothetical protein